MAIYHTSNPDAPTLGQRLKVLARRKSTALITTGFVLAVALPFVYGLPSLYSASATVIVEGQAQDAQAGGLAGDIDSRLQAIKQEALSRSRLTELLDQYNLYPSLRGKVPTELLLRQLQKDIKIDLVSTDAASSRPTTIAFKITYTSRDPETAAAVTNRLASFYVAQNDNMRSRQATRTTEVIRQGLTDTKARLDRQEARMESFLSAHMGRLPQQVDANLLALGRLNGQLQFNAEQQSKLMERRQELQKQIADLDMTVASTTASAAAADPVVKLQQAKRELADLQSKFNDSYPDVRDKKGEVARLEREVSGTNGRSPATSALQGQKAALTAALREVESKLDDLSKENRSLRTQTTTYESRVESAPARGPEYDGLAKDYQSTREQYDQLLKKYDDARLVESLEHDRSGQEFRILDAALPPPVAAGPNRLRLLLLSLALGVVLGVGAALLRDRLDTSFHNIDDLRAFTQVPVLVSIPRIFTAGDLYKRRFRTLVMTVTVVGALIVIGSGALRYAHGSDQIARLLLQVG